MRKTIWESTEEEKITIKNLYEKKNALENLFKIISEDSEIYERVIKDYTETLTAFNNWWMEMVEKYDCDKNIVNKLSIDFVTNEVWCE